MDLQDKVIIVTGSGRGLGAATAELCAQHGAKVVVSDIRANWGKNVVNRIREHGLEASFCQADMSDETAVAALVEFAALNYGQLDGIVNNAAVMVVGKVANLTTEDWHKVINVNLTGVFFGCKYAIQQFHAQGTGGSIVNIGSISAVVGLPEQPAYCSSKGGVIQLTRQIAIDYAQENIRCNTVGPGSIDGEFVWEYINGQEDPALAEKQLVGGHPMKRMAKPTEIGDAIVFLLSDRSSFVTGANLQVDGGYSAI